MGFFSALIPGATAETYRSREKWRHWKIWLWLVLMLLGAGVLVVGIYEEMQQQRYATEGVRVEAAVLGTYMSGGSARVKYSFTAAGGEVMTCWGAMEAGAEWEKAKASGKVEVVYLPRDAEWNQLVAGEDPEVIGGMHIKWWGALDLVMFGGLFLAACWDYDVVSRLTVLEVWHKGRMVWRFPGG